jgi:HEPN domain-containing protein
MEKARNKIKTRDTLKSTAVLVSEPQHIYGVSKVNQAVRHWVESSDDDFKTMNNLFKSRDYAWALFVGHLVIEKLLKACYVRNRSEHPPMIHNLVKISQSWGLELSDELHAKLTEITTFNIGTRYDDFKKSFYKQCTKEFTTNWIKEIKSIRLWIKEEQLK